MLAYGRAIQQAAAPARGSRHLRQLVDSLAQVCGEIPEADHGRAVRALLRMQTRRSLVIWITDFAETPTTPEVIEQAAAISRRHLVVFAAISQPDLGQLARAVPESAEEMFRHAAAIEVVQRRELLMRGLRQRGVIAVDLAPGVLSSSLINQYLEVKDRNLL
jgi:uncharacterized protein (DUF58 family)